MATENTGFVTCGVGENLNTGGVNWSNPSRITNTTDSSFASGIVSDGGGNPVTIPLEYINGRSFSLGVPESAVIMGIEARARGRLVASTTGVFGFSNEEVRIRKGTTFPGTVKDGFAFDTSLTTAVRGSPSDLWGLGSAATPAYVNAPDFGISFKSDVTVDNSSGGIELVYMQVRVTYEATSKVFVWDGSAWVAKEVQVRQSTDWQTAEVLIWDGASWVESKP